MSLQFDPPGMSLRKPTWEPLWLRCGACGRQFDDWQPAMVPLPVWVAALKALRCPQCGSKHLFIRTTPLT